MNLADNACREAFATECEQVSGNLNRLSARGLKTALLTAANRQLALCGVAQLGYADDPGSTANGYFDFGPWALTFGGAANESASKTHAMVASLADTVYHESRHCEQWFRIAQMAASGRLPVRMGVPAIRADAPGLAQDMGISPTAAAAAVANSNFGASGISAVTITTWFTSIYGAHGTRRGNIYAFLQNEYDRYRNLPEEQDAWRLGGAVGDSVRVALNIRADYPSYHDWMALTKRSWYNKRSTELKRVDAALQVYDGARTVGNKALLKIAFDAWYGPKNNQTIRNVLDAEGVGVVDRLNAFLA